MLFNFINKIRKKINDTTNYILYAIIYFIGIGITSLFSKIVGKKFIDISPKKTSWNTPTGSDNLEKMY